MMGMLQKVILVYEDEIRILEGEEAENWDQMILDLIVLGSIHGAIPDFSQFNWQVFKKVPEEE